ncbi:Bug family tripartite tricarboxylate transporter substrate binding protein [Falsiroseomonas sp. HW251]|uniref:Bug family tripartite tricarboxylate transporter substrate binding protein n=1 Tax=Falsiroseomonas sp. HW251 TaxID=3390998 RepID=UPI003D311096
MATRRLLLATAAALAGARGAAAQSWPTRPVRIVVGFGAGGLADIVVRLVAAPLAEKLGQNVVVDNRPGAGGALAAQAVAGAPADGHTLILFTSGTSISKALFRSLPFDPVTGFAPVSTLAIFDALLLSSNTSPIRAVADLAARRGTPMTIGTLTAGSTQHLTAEMVRLSSGLQLTPVPFRTSPEVLTALRRGDIDLAIESYGAAAGDIRDGAVRALASTGSKRSPLLPFVPTLTEAGYRDCVMEGWQAIFAPAGVPDAVVTRLNADIREILARPAISQRFLELGVEASGSAPDALGRLLRDDIVMWNGIIDRAGVERQ